MSKAFKICDGFSEIYAMILQKFQDNEVHLTLKDDLYINFEFTLPNKKIDLISFDSKKEKIKESELIEKLFENISFLQEKNTELQEQITKLTSKKKLKTFIDILSKKFKVSDITLLNDLFSSLKNFDLEDEYLKEIMNKFQSKTNTIYNIKKDECSIQNLIAKVFGKKNLAGQISVFSENKGENKFGSNFAYLDGKLEFENGYLSFLTKGVFSYGSYGNNDEFKFTHFRDDNAKIFIKILKGCIYLIIYKTKENILGIIKLNDNFDKNPFFYGNIIRETNKNNDELINLFESSIKKQKESNQKKNINENEKNMENNKKKENKDEEEKIEIFEIFEIYLKELKVFQIVS